MSEPEIIARLRRILGAIAPDLELATVDPDADLRNDIGLDSMDFLNFVIAAHKEIGVDVPEADYGKIPSLAAFARYVAASQSRGR